MDIAITWPKSRPLESYLAELKKAADAGLVINFKVPTWPKRIKEGERCYIVYDGFVRGYNNILGVDSKDDVIDPITGQRMAPGVYVVREPTFYDTGSPHVAIDSFRGYRYVEREFMEDAELASWWRKAKVA